MLYMKDPTDRLLRKYQIRRNLERRRLELRTKGKWAMKLAIGLVVIAIVVGLLNFLFILSYDSEPTIEYHLSDMDFWIYVTLKCDGPLTVDKTVSISEVTLYAFPQYNISIISIYIYSPHALGNFRYNETYDMPRNHDYYDYTLGDGFEGDIEFQTIGEAEVRLHLGLQTEEGWKERWNTLPPLGVYEESVERYLWIGSQEQHTIYEYTRWGALFLSIGIAVLIPTAVREIRDLYYGWRY